MNRRRLMIAALLVLLAATCSHLATASFPVSASVAVATAVPADADVVPPMDGEPPIAIAAPLLILGIAMVLVLGLIIGVKIHPFITLVIVAMVVSALAVGILGVGTWSDSIERVAVSFGTAAGNIGIVIGLAAVIGKCMLDSGAADRIVRAFLQLFGEKRSAMALMGSGFVLAVPVFFDTVFYLLVPLGRSLYRRTQKNYLLYVLAIGGGGAITHTLVPPTPGPLVMASRLGVDVGVLIFVGTLVAVPAAVAGLLFAQLANRWMPIPMRSLGDQTERPPLPDSELPSLWLSLAPVLLPVVLISANTIVQTVARTRVREQLVQTGVVQPTNEQLAELLQNPAEITDIWAQHLVHWSSLTQVLGNANLALLAAALIALATLVVQRGLTRKQMAATVEGALMSGGVIILITSAGGAFGDMLEVAQVGEAIRELFVGVGGAGLVMLLLGFSIAAVLKTAQGSSTVAMITGSAMLAGIASPETLGFHPVYLATSIGGGALVGSWMNDSGFWIFAKMSGLTEVEALKSWTIMLVVLATTSLLATILMALVLPFPLA